MNNTFVIVELNEHLRVNNCYVFSDENEAAKCTLLLQFNDCELIKILSDLKKQGYSDGVPESSYDLLELVIDLFKNGEYILAYEKFSNYYWEVSYKPVYYFKASHIADLPDFDKLQSFIAEEM